MFASSIPRLELGSFVLIGQLSFVHRLSKCCLGLLLCLQMNTTTATVEIKPATRPTTSPPIIPNGVEGELLSVSPSSVSGGGLAVTEQSVVPVDVADTLED